MKQEPTPLPSETRYRKVGRRYHPVEARFDRIDLKIPVGKSALITCTAPGCSSYLRNVEPDRATFLSAVALFRDAMVQAINEAAIATPQMEERPYTKAELDCIQRFRKEMAALGSLLPTYWTSASAHAIADAAVRALETNTYATQPEF